MNKLIEANAQEVHQMQKTIEELRVSLSELPAYQRRISKQNDLIFDLQTQLIELSAR